MATQRPSLPPSKMFAIVTILVKIPKESCQQILRNFKNRTLINVLLHHVTTHDFINFVNQKHS